MTEDEIDLRAYIEIALHHWIWILGPALVAAVVAFVVSPFLPPSYRASAVVLVTEPRLQMQFDPRIGTEEQTPAYKVFPTLATSDRALQEVLDSYLPSPQAGIDEWSLSTLSKMVEATSGGDPSLVVLSVTSRSPQDAAAIANGWADILARLGNEIYGGSQKDVVFFQSQLKQAEEALDAADTALVQFQARNQASIIEAQLSSRLQSQDDLLANQRTIAQLVQDIQGLRSQLADQPGNPSPSLADDLTALFLQIRAFNAQATAPIQLQVDGSTALSDKTQAEQIAFLDGLVVTLQARSSEVDTLLAELEPEILDLQRKAQEASVENDRLTRTRDLARETYLTLARKLEEAHIAAQEEDRALQVGSYAAVPERPVRPRRLLNTALAGVLGLLIGVVVAFAIEFWQQNGRQARGGEG
jgi:succinoglycan biosynthesis transport protein ExoP